MRYPYIVLAAIIFIVCTVKATLATLLTRRDTIIQGFDALVQEEYKNKFDIRQSTNMHRFVPRQHDGNSQASASAGGYQASSSSSSSGGGHQQQQSGHGGQKKSVFANNPAVTSGALFYLALAVSVVLWCTGYALDFVLDRDERMVDQLLTTSIPEKV